MDGRADLGFDRTHPLVLDHLARCLRPVPVSAETPADARLFVADTAARCR